jgi:hypothetical protein
MTRPTRYRINAAICVLVLAYAIYQFATGDYALSPGPMRAWLVGGEAAVGAIGAIWFWRRSLAA